MEKQKTRLSIKQLSERFRWLYTQTGAGAKHGDFTAKELCNAYRIVIKDLEGDWRKPLKP